MKFNNVVQQDNVKQHEKGTQANNPAQRVNRSIGIQTEAIATNDSWMTPAA